MKTGKQILDFVDDKISELSKKAKKSKGENKANLESSVVTLVLLKMFIKS